MKQSNMTKNKILTKEQKRKKGYKQERGVFKKLLYPFIPFGIEAIKRLNIGSKRVIENAYSAYCSTDLYKRNF